MSYDTYAAKLDDYRSQKPEFFKIINSQTFFVKISWIGHWVVRIDWCEGWATCATSMPFTSINLTNPRTNPWNFHNLFFRIGHLEKLGFWVGHFERSIIQTFWRLHCWTKFLVFELILQMLATCLFFYFVWLIAKFWKDWTTFILNILQGSPLWIETKNNKEEMSNENVVQSFWNFAISQTK